MLRTQDIPKDEGISNLPATPPSVSPPAEDMSHVNNGHAPDETRQVIENHPLAPLAGVFNDEPLWDDFLQAIQEYRQRMNEQDEQACEFLRRVLQNYSRFRILPYDIPAKKVFDSMTAAEKRVGRNDCKIAAIAMSRGYTVVTRNVKDFTQIRGAIYEDWTKEP